MSTFFVQAGGETFGRVINTSSPSGIYGNVGGGGVGLAMANWITSGDPGFDVWGMDVSRFGDWTTPGYTLTKVIENYSRRFKISFPNEELPAGRPQK